jgi:excisionase family DNA binding protein
MGLGRQAEPVDPIPTEGHAMGRARPRPSRRAAEPSEATEWLTVAEAAERLDLNPRTLRRAAAVGNLEARRSGKVWLTTLGAVRAWLKDARHRPGPRLGQGVGRPRQGPLPSPATA